MENNHPSTELSINNVLSDAWHAVNGRSLGTIWIIVLALGIVAGIFHFIISLILGVDPKNPSFWDEFVIMPILTNALIAPFYAGAVMTAIKRVRNETLSPSSGFQYLNQYWPLAITMVIVSFIASIPMMIIYWPTIAASLGKGVAFWGIIAGLLTALVYTFWLIAIPLVADKSIRPLQAIAQSFHTIKPYWTKVYALILIGYACLVVAMIPSFLGIIFQNTIILLLGIAIFIVAIVWIIPFLFLIQGTIYHKLIDKV